MKNEGSGVLILAIVFIVLGITNQTIFGILYDKGSVTQLLITIGSILIGVAGCVLGVKLLRKTGDSVAEVIRWWNDNLYTLEDIHDFYREVREDQDTLIFLANKKKVKAEDGYKGLYILRSDSKLYGMDCHKDFSEKLMAEIGKRNPLTILARRFTYEGNNYDVYSNKDQVIAIYKENLERQLF